MDTDDEPEYCCNQNGQIGHAFKLFLTDKTQICTNITCYYGEYLPFSKLNNK